MENSNDQGTKEIPQTLISKYSYIDFKKICESYSNILTLILNENNNNKLFSKDDIFVLNDLIHEKRKKKKKVIIYIIYFIYKLFKIFIKK